MNNFNWPDELDAMVAARNHHKVLFEDDTVRVLDAAVAPGDTVPVHTHRWPGVLYILGWSDFVRRDPDGNVILNSREAGVVLPVGGAVWGGALTPHSLENVGDSELRIISVEMKNSA